MIRVTATNARERHKQADVNLEMPPLFTRVYQREKERIGFGRRPEVSRDEKERWRGFRSAGDE